MRLAPAAAVLFAGCVHAPALENVERPDRAREAPPSFETMSIESVHTNMWELAKHAHEIDRSIRVRGDATQAQVVGELDQMILIADRLAQDDARRAHPVLAWNIEAFQADLRLARAHALKDPPNYFLAGTVAGSCQLCHGRGPGKLN